MKNGSGLTLIELLLAISLSASLLITASSFFWQATRSWKITAVKYSRQQISRLCLERMERDLRSASQLLPSSTSEEVIFVSGGEVLSYRLFDRKLRRKKGATSSYLTVEDEIEDLSFSYPASQAVLIRSGKRSLYVFARN